MLFAKFDKLYFDYEAIVEKQVTPNKIFKLVYSVNDKIKYKSVKNSFRLMEAEECF